MPSKNTNLSRSWKCVFVNQQSVNPANAAFQICLTSRTDGAAVNYVHDTLYGSIRYSISQQIMLPELQETTLLMMRLQVLDAVKGTEIRGKKDKLNGEKIIDGVTETSMHLKQQHDSESTKEATNWSKCFSVTSKIKFLDVSSNYDGSPFRFQISYYDPRALEQPIMVVQSAPFKVYARRKRKRGTSAKTSSGAMTKKSKSLTTVQLKEDLHDSDLCSDSMDCYNSMHPAEFDAPDVDTKKMANPAVSFTSTLAEPPVKRQKLSSDELFQLYISEFDQLMDLTKKMDEEDRKKAVRTALQHLIGAPLPPQQQPQMIAAPSTVSNEHSNSANTHSANFFDKMPQQQQQVLEQAPLSFNDPMLTLQHPFQFPQPKLISTSLDVVHNPPSTVDEKVVMSTHPLNFEDNLVGAFGVPTFGSTPESNLFGSFGF